MSINNDVIGVPPLDGWEALSLINGWQRYGADWPPPRAFIDPFGLVHLSGLIRDGVGITFATLPLRFRPTFILNLPCAQKRYNQAPASGRIAVLLAGQLLADTTGLEYLSLDGICYRLD